MINIKDCALKDIDLLAEMNRQLIEDEKADNVMDIFQLKNRMIDFLKNGYSAYFITNDEKVIGYALIDTAKDPKYLRQFFIIRGERRKHYGKEAFAKLLEELDVNEIDIDVLKRNEIGTRFWEGIGFKEQWKRMRYKKQYFPEII